MLTFKQFIHEGLRRALAMGGATVAAGAATGAVTGLGAVAGGAIAGGWYALSGEMRKDLKKKRGDWNYNKLKEEYLEEAPPPGEWGEWARRMVTTDPKNATWAYGKAWKEHKAGTPPPKVRSKKQRNDKVGEAIKSPPKKKYQQALRTAKKQRKQNKRRPLEVKASKAR